MPFHGYPSEATIPASALEVHVARRLWEVSEMLANVDFDADAGTSFRISRNVPGARAEG
jgi:hypothetical protein